MNEGFSRTSQPENVDLTVLAEDPVAAAVRDVGFQESLCTFSLIDSFWGVCLRRCSSTETSGSDCGASGASRAVQLRTAVAFEDPDVGKGLVEEA